jgi:prefoldin subunit 5
MIGFAMPEERSNAASYYMNNIEKLKLFITSFEKDYSELRKRIRKK